MMKVCYDIILGYVNNKDVLDIGSCANQGEKVKSKTLYSSIKKAAKSVTGVDIESDTEEIIRGNAETIRLGREFDVVVAGDVIEHIYNAGLFLDNMHSHLRKDGLMLVVTPNAKSIGYLPFKGNQFHTCWYCKNTLKYLLEQHGFKVEKIIVGLRKRKNPFKDLLRHIFANNLLFVCRKVTDDSS